MRITIEHKTHYRYASEVTYSIQSLRLTPASFVGHTVVDWRISSTPLNSMPAGRDGFGNVTHLLVIAGRHREVEITASGTVDVEDRAGVVLGLADLVPLRAFLRRTQLTEPSPEIVALAEALAPGDTISRLHMLMGKIRDRVDYLPGITSAETIAADAMKAGMGVCQDHAHIFIAAARQLGLPARYVTGYLLTDGNSQAAAHHAWAEVWVDGLGWLGFDVANRACPTDHYVRLGAGLDASHAAPIRGSRRGGDGETMAVEVLVQQSGSSQQ